MIIVFFLKVLILFIIHNNNMINEKIFNQIQFMHGIFSRKRNLGGILSYLDGILSSGILSSGILSSGILSVPLVYDSVLHDLLLGWLYVGSV